MPRNFDGTLGDAVLAMAPRESLLVQRLDNAVALTAASRADARSKESREVVTVNLVPPDTAVIKAVAEAVNEAFKVTRSQHDVGIEAGKSPRKKKR